MTRHLYCNNLISAQYLDFINRKVNCLNEDYIQIKIKIMIESILNLIIPNRYWIILLVIGILLMS